MARRDENGPGGDLPDEVPGDAPRAETETGLRRSVHLESAHDLAAEGLLDEPDGDGDQLRGQLVE